MVAERWVHITLRRVVGAIAPLLGPFLNHAKGQGHDRPLSAGSRWRAPRYERRERGGFVSSVGATTVVRQLPSVTERASSRRRNTRAW